MTDVAIMTAAGLGLDDEDWSNPNTLDAVLLGKRLLRSDAGAIPSETILATEIDDEDIPQLEHIGAALALQRAILCVMTSEKTKPPHATIEEIVHRVESRGAVHDRLIAAELNRSKSVSIIAEPPEAIYEYRPGTVIGLLRRALDAMDTRTYGTESCGVANSLCRTEDLMERLDAARYNELRLSDGSASQTTDYPTAIRNNLAWIARNPNADDMRTSRYLKAYDTDIDDLLERVSRL